MADENTSPPSKDPEAGKASRLPPAEQPKPRRRDARTDIMQLGLLLLFVVVFFATAFASRSGFIFNGRFAELVFLSLAASITLYYFLDTVANVSQTTYSLAGAGAVFVVVLTIGLYYTSSEDEIQRRDAQIKDLTEQVTRNATVTIKGQVLDDKTRKSIDGVNADLRIGALIQGDFYSNDATEEHYYTIENVPVQKTYKLVIIEFGKNKSYLKTAPADAIAGGFDPRIPSPESSP